MGVRWNLLVVAKRPAGYLGRRAISGKASFKSSMAGSIRDAAVRELL